MRYISVCSECENANIEFTNLREGKCYCNKCRKETYAKDIYVKTPFERTRDLVYATGNRWAIENFNATHY